MKWVTFISCLFLLSFTESKHLYRASRDAEEPDTIQRAQALGEQFKDVSIVLYSQSLQQWDFDEVMKVVGDTMTVAQKCAADPESDPACKKKLDALLYDEICHEEASVNKHGMTQCCAQTDPERHECFLTHKNESPGFIAPYQKPEPEEACQKFHDNQEDVLHHYLYEMGRRSPRTNVANILQTKLEYAKVIEVCCQAEDKHACFVEKATAVKKKFMEASAMEKNMCLALKKFGVESVEDYKLVRLAQLFPKATLPRLTGFAKQIGHIYEECCRGDTLDCMLHREKLADTICSHHAEISSKLADCCSKHILERGVCIAHVEPDEKPEDLSPTVRHFIDDQDVCKRYAEDKHLLLTEFEYEYARRHTELPEVLVLRLSKGYEEMLEKCCSTDDPVTCLQKGEELLKKHLADVAATVKTNCDLFKQIGAYLFENHLIILYAKRVPQLLSEKLLHLTQKLTDIATQCCHLEDDKRLSCAISKVDIAQGYLCKMHDEHHINKQVCKCCSDSYVKRQDCIGGLGVDPEYVPVEFDPEIVTFHADYCDAKPEDQQHKKQMVLSKFVQHKPAVTDEQMAATTVDFSTVIAECCASENRQECLDKETPKLIERTKAALEDH